MGKKDKSAKRKARESEVGTELPTHTNIADKHEVDVIDDLNEPTMGEKLASLNLKENNNSQNLDIVAKPPSADSVYILLKQALRADDRALLVDCIDRQDEKVIRNSLSVLNPSDVLKFLQSLVSIIQLRGAVVARSLPWLRSLLLQHAGSIMSQESSLAALNTLYQIIESRVSTFNNAVELSSSLDLLYAETVDDGEEENVVIPAIYEDESSDDEGSDVSMEVDDVEDDDETRQPRSDISEDEENGEISD